ncbi:ankyrin repeat domain-containing protein 65-like [Schistocerca cancellata]|uniref:ankyrin repeat domain-containing protein 65-like n=1 Tax=Schistocerca cancellata TaxID=274614 RepID=UPI002118B452|nr:ankyrin repeat domain-containing protein 65-like [Schistocerca cancellata]
MARERKKTVEFYYSVLRELYNLTDAIPTRLKDIKQIKAKLSSLKRKKLEGLEMKSKAESVTEDETAAVYHLVRHAKNRSSFVDELQINDGTILTTQKEIITETSAYYERMYASGETNEGEYDELFGAYLPRISRDDDNISSDITKEDLLEIVSLSAKERGRRLLQAADRGAVGQLRALIAAGAHVGARGGGGQTALHWAAQRGDVEAARLLVGAGAAVGARNGGGWTPLHVAAFYWQADVAAALLDAGADRGATTGDGRTALDMARQSLSAEERGRRLVQAAERGAVGELRAMIAAGADVGATNGGGWTALHWAACKGDGEAARLLVGAGAVVDARNDSGWTPLHYAAAYGHAEVAAALLVAGADRGATTGGWGTALDIARRCNRRRLVVMLL